MSTSDHSYRSAAQERESRRHKCKQAVLSRFLQKCFSHVSSGDTDSIKFQVDRVHKQDLYRGTFGTPLGPAPGFNMNCENVLTSQDIQDINQGLRDSGYSSTMIVYPTDTIINVNLTREFPKSSPTPKAEPVSVECPKEKPPAEKPITHPKEEPSEILTEQPYRKALPPPLLVIRDPEPTYNGYKLFGGIAVLSLATYFAVKKVN